MDCRMGTPGTICTVAACIKPERSCACARMKAWPPHVPVMRINPVMTISAGKCQRLPPAIPEKAGCNHSRGL